MKMNSSERLTEYTTRNRARREKAIARETVKRRAKDEAWEKKKIQDAAEGLFYPANANLR
jgi:hypothetical protein